jgi:hypothetical protein
MFQRTQQQQPPSRWTEPKWLNSTVSSFKGTLSDIHRYIPTFERRDFAFARSSDEHFRMNERLDTIVRLPFREDNTLVPVGVVSKNYALVPHTAVLNVAIQALDRANISAADVKAEIKITEYGERMALSLYLPDKYSFDPGDGNPMALRLECTNSVDGSTRFRALMGWFRFVCSNGLIIGVTQSDVRRRHVGDLILGDVHTVLTSGISVSEVEKKNFERWRNVEIRPDKLASWVDKELRAGWGFKAAARTFHIAQHGMDAEIIGQYKDNAPTTIAMRPTNPVPGTPKYCSNLFDVTQVLAWLAKERRDVQEQLEWREGIPNLTASLLH